MITVCAARDSTFYIIMMKDTKEYHGKVQRRRGGLLVTRGKE